VRIGGERDARPRFDGVRACKRDGRVARARYRVPPAAHARIERYDRLLSLAAGIGDGSKVAIAWSISVWVILVNAAYGAAYSAKTRSVLARLYKTSRLNVFRHIVLIEALPQTSMGLRTALPLTLIIVVVSEMLIGSSSGLGQRIYDAYLTYEVATLYAWLIITGFIGYGLNVLYTMIERRALHWVGRA
jgi:NitT/TauT family transport system permease protein